MARGKIRPHHLVIIDPHEILRCSCISYMSVYIVNFLQALKKGPIMISQKHSITAAIGGNVIDIIYVGELEIHTTLTYHYVTYSVWPCPLLIVLYLAFTAKTLHIPDLEGRYSIFKLLKTEGCGYKSFLGAKHTDTPSSVLLLLTATSCMSPPFPFYFNSTSCLDSLNYIPYSFNVRRFPNSPFS